MGETSLLVSAGTNIAVAVIPISSNPIPDDHSLLVFAERHKMLVPGVVVAAFMANQALASTAASVASESSVASPAPSARPSRSSRRVSTGFAAQEKAIASQQSSVEPTRIVSVSSQSHEPVASASIAAQESTVASMPHPIQQGFWGWRYCRRHSARQRCTTASAAH